MNNSWNFMFVNLFLNNFNWLRSEFVIMFISDSWSTCIVNFFNFVNSSNERIIVHFILNARFILFRLRRNLIFDSSTFTLRTFSAFIINCITDDWDCTSDWVSNWIEECIWDCRDCENEEKDNVFDIIENCCEDWADWESWVISRCQFWIVWEDVW
jgi:hypothetical protein